MQRYLARFCQESDPSVTSKDVINYAFDNSTPLTVVSSIEESEVILKLEVNEYHRYKVVKLGKVIIDFAGKTIPDGLPYISSVEENSLDNLKMFDVTVGYNDK